MWEVPISRAINRLTGGNPQELFCSRIHREKRVTLIFIINTLFLDRNHVRRAYRWERKTMAKKKRDCECECQILEEDFDQPLLPLDERFRRSEQFEFDLYPDEKESNYKKVVRQLARIINQ